MNSAPTTTTFELLESTEMFSASASDPTFGVGGVQVGQTVGFPVADIALQADG